MKTDGCARLTLSLTTWTAPNDFSVVFAGQSSNLTEFCADIGGAGQQRQMIGSRHIIAPFTHYVLHVLNEFPLYTAVGGRWFLTNHMPVPEAEFR
jgi:hypothetical protein